MAAYQIGDAFPGRTWAQWNGKFRDDCRSFLRAENGATEAFATRVLGSPDLFPDAPGRSINFVTAHDGFTVYDLVSYEHKRNQANGQNGHDGTDDNRSWNCGWEGDDMPEEAAAAVSALRLQQIKNAFVMLMLSAGVPMMLAGDEFAQTQRGNNNPYNQDNETTWLDWSRQQRFAELTEFVRDLLALRRSSPSIPVVLHGVDIAPDTGWESHSLAWQRGDLYVMANMWWEPLEFTVHAEGGWQIGLSSAPPVASGTDRFRLAPRSTVVLRRC
jgi:isoamylase